MDDRQRRGIGWRTERPALHPLAGKVAGLLQGALGDRDTLQPDMQPGVVHHREHVFEPAVLLADAPADGVFVGQHASRRGVDAELVLEAQHPDLVPRPRRAVIAGEELRHQEQRQPAAPGRRSRHPRQDHMDDVRRQIVIAVRDEDLLPGDPVMVAPDGIAARLGPAAQRPEIRPGLRLGQVHRPGPLAGDQPAEIAPLLLGRAARL